VQLPVPAGLGFFIWRGGCETVVSGHLFFFFLLYACGLPHPLAATRASLPPQLYVIRLMGKGQNDLPMD
jgi:hypothetical protein